MRNKFYTALVMGAWLAWGLSSVGAAQSTNKDIAVQGADKTGDAPVDEMSDAEVKKIDKELGKITLKHGEIKSLGMPSMTMVFYVNDKTLLDQVQAGEKIKFKVIRENGKMLVTMIQKSK